MIQPQTSRPTSIELIIPKAEDDLLSLIITIHKLEQLDPTESYQIHTYSSYVYRGIVRFIPQWQATNWIASKGEIIKNKELWQKLASLTDVLNLNWRLEVEIVERSGVLIPTKSPRAKITNTIRDLTNNLSKPQTTHTRQCYFCNLFFELNSAFYKHVEIYHKKEFFGLTANQRIKR